MANYLLVADQTATSPLVMRRAHELHEADQDARFTILVPARHVEGRLTWDEPATREAALERAREATEAFREAGLRVRRAEPGDSNPVLAIADELRLHPDEHDAIIVSTLPPATSRWRRLGLPEAARRRFDLPVLQVYEGGEQAWAESKAIREALARGAAPTIAEAEPRRSHVPALVPYQAVLPALLAVYIATNASLAVFEDMRFLVAGAVVLGILAMIALPLGLLPAWRRSEDLPELPDRG